MRLLLRRCLHRRVRRRLCRAAQLALVNGAAGAVWAQGGKPRVVFGFTIADGKIVAIGILADRNRLSQLDLAVIND